MIAKVIHRTELGPLDASETASALCTTRSCARIAVVEAHHAAIRSSSHSSMKAENWFQLRIVGVTKKDASSELGSDPMVVATTASEELRPGFVSGTLGWSELARAPEAARGPFHP